MLIMAALNIRNGTMTVGGFVVVNTYLMQLSIPLNFLGTVYREIRQALVDLENMFTLLEEVPEIKDLPGAQPLSSPRGDIRFTDVHFGYDAQRVILHGISFQVNAGEKVAIVGPTGAGKSTISRLLLRFYDPNSGRIAVDGLDLQAVSYTHLPSPRDA